MALWIRVMHGADVKFGTLEDGEITVYEGEMFGHSVATSERVPLGAIEVLTPCRPSKMIGLWNNLRPAATKQGWAEPREPLYFLKPPSTFLAPGREIMRPRSYDGKVIFEGELGVVIGRRCRDIAEAEAADCVFGYTCVNDVTAVEIIHENPSFAQWSRAKSFDTFGPFGPVIATDLDPGSLRVTTHVGGRTRQDYGVSDMFFKPLELVQRISRDTTLLPGDLIACGTSTGALPMRPGSTVEVRVDGIGTLSNTFSADPREAPSP